MVFMIRIDLTQVHEFMRRKRLNQKKLATLLGYSESYIYYLFCGKREPSSKFMERLSIVMNTEITDIFYISRTYNQ